MNDTVYMRTRRPVKVGDFLSLVDFYISTPPYSLVGRGPVSPSLSTACGVCNKEGSKYFVVDSQNVGWILSARKNAL